MAILARVSASRRCSFAASQPRRASEIRGAAGEAPDRVELEVVRRHAEAVEERVVELHELGVDGRVVRADRLDGGLPVLAVATFPRGAVAVHRRDREQLRRLGIAVHPVLDVGATDRRRPLGPQRQRAVGAVGEAVHLLLDDVGSLARGARKQRRVLEHGRQHLAVAVEPAQSLDLARHALPERHLCRNDVVGPAWSLDPVAHRSVRSPRSPARKGFVARSAARVVSGPWPG